MQEMTCIVEFATIVAAAAERRLLRQLDLSSVTKMLRTRIFEMLPQLPQLHSLILGSGSGGWSDVWQTKFLNGLFVMEHLVVFSLTYDCNDEMLRMLRRNCGRTIRVIDAEHSQMVTDEGADELARCPNLEQLHLFHTAITPWGHARILRRLKNLKLLVRGDFLCEALQVLAEESPDWTLQIEEFWSSEHYFFHDEAQLALVSRMCPRIRKMMFQFSAEVVSSFLALSRFQSLTELHSWGGDFYKNSLDKLLELIGDRLRVLYLIHVDELDQNAVALISDCCRGLVTLGFYNCIFTEQEERIAGRVGDNHADVQRLGYSRG